MHDVSHRVVVKPVAGCDRGCHALAHATSCMSRWLVSSGITVSFQILGVHPASWPIVTTALHWPSLLRHTPVPFDNPSAAAEASMPTAKCGVW